MDESDLENADETHSVINMDNGRTMGLKGTEKSSTRTLYLGGRE